jgi:hypothetical protein
MQMEHACDTHIGFEGRNELCAPGGNATDEKMF